MDNARRLLTIASIFLVAVGILSLAANLFLNASLNVSWPLLLMVLGIVFYIVSNSYTQRWAWAALLYLPGSVLFALGTVFLLNVITGDWNSWAYAWLLVVAGLGLGTVLAGRGLRWPEEIILAGAGLIAVGIVLFTLFGAIGGGRFILVMAPILLVLGGLALRFLRPESILPERLLQRLKSAGAQPLSASATTPDQGTLAEPLSTRELEVLRLIDQGLSNQEIAERLTLAPSTVKTHINNIYGKLGVQTRVQALNRARELKLLVPD